MEITIPVDVIAFRAIDSRRMGRKGSSKSTRVMVHSNDPRWPAQIDGLLKGFGHVAQRVQAVRLEHR